ncbi:hypothetical protein GCM10010172_30930 [Paractinoplanes ferrugineus]|uniref:XRE family transcriptional regulator n=1 Tax=Paractinoplanes ferrugineus TaxID=113564 RepID=A0A919J496_9ACTN|nr:hypothetical protein [Actinoplanes ferrugineus]GIE14215.1 hypothetical protein Afe05nite_60550 [Actinoplanes ferrugineus]
MEKPPYTPNKLFRDARVRLFGTREALAEAANQHLAAAFLITANDIGKIERGVVSHPRAPRRAALRKVLEVATDAEIGLFDTHARDLADAARCDSDGKDADIDRRTLLRGSVMGASLGLGSSSFRQELARPAEHQEGPRSSLPEAVRIAVLAADTPAAERDVAGILEVQKAVTEIHEAYQRAQYNEAAALVPALMSAASSLAAKARHDDRHLVDTTVASAHLAVSKLTLKFGDAELAWIAADRARACVVEANSFAPLQVALVSIGCALLSMPGRGQDAASLVERGLSKVTPPGRRGPREISALGALNLLAAVIAARLDDRPKARAHIRVARELAVDLGGDRNELWTAFGPTNVLIHQIGIAARHEPERAIALGEKLDTTRLHVALASRRSQVHLDLASAFGRQLGGDASAVLHLLEAEQLAPQLLRVHPPARSLIINLLARERRAATPGLRALAIRAGVAA